MIEKKTNAPLLLCRHGYLSGIRAGKWSGDAPLEVPTIFNVAPIPKH
jgi:hypothetical protein